MAVAPDRDRVGRWQTLAWRLLIPSDDREQEIRFRRYLLAVATSLLVVFLLGVCVLEGTLPQRPFAITTGIALVSIVAFYFVIRTGLNRRARDPSLTVPMMVAAICTVTYTLYHLGEVRTAFLVVYPVIMFFGVLRLGTGSFLLVAVFIMSAYAFMITLLAAKPGALDSMRIEILRGLVLGTVLVWFSFMGGYVHDLRRRLRESGYDPLTEIHTRGRVLEVLAHEQTRYQRGAGPFCVCLLDVDALKDINDSLGHHVGDLALQAIAQIAHRELRLIDAIGRYGGDEFLLVLSQTDLDGARECAERIRGRIERSDCIAHSPRRQVRISGGVTQYRHGESLQDTLHRADMALYRAKTNGRNRIECD